MSSSVALTAIIDRITADLREIKSVVAPACANKVDSAIEEEDVNDMLIRGAQTKNYDLCKHAHKKGAQQVNIMLYEAAKIGSRELCELAKKWGANWYALMYEGAKQGLQREICELAVSWSTGTVLYVLGDRAIVPYFHSSCPTITRDAREMLEICHREFVAHIVDRPACYPPDPIKSAVPLVRHRAQMCIIAAQVDLQGAFEIEYQRFICDLNAIRQQFPHDQNQIKPLVYALHPITKIAIDTGNIALLNRIRNPILANPCSGLPPSEFCIHNLCAYALKAGRAEMSTLLFREIQGEIDLNQYGQLLSSARDSKPR